MKYRNLNKPVPQEKRAEVNEKILHLIHTNSAEDYKITKEVIYNSYSGVGGLSGIDFKDHDSFYSYTKAKQELEQGQFFTPHTIAEYIVNALEIPNNSNVADITCGSGVFFNFLSHCQCFGNEIDNRAVDICRYLYPEVNLTFGDMIDYKNSVSMDYVVGNPPFNLDIRYKNKYMKSQMVYIDKANQLIKKGGILAIIVPMSFLNDEFSNKSDIEYMNDTFNFIGQEKLKSDTFKEMGVDDFDTKIIIFAKKSEYISENKYMNQFTDISEVIKKYYTEYKTHKNNIKLENRRISSLSNEFEFKVKKYLYDIEKSLPKEKFFQSKNLLNRFYIQSKPDNMSQEAWEKMKLTEQTVMKAMKQILSEQHGKKWGKKHLTSVKADKMQSLLFEDIKIKPDIQDIINKPIIDCVNNKEICLNPVQLEIVNKMLQKKYGYIQSSQGTGKTLMSIFYSEYRAKINHTANTLVVAPAIAINTTWSETLSKYKISYVNIKKYRDLNKIETGKYIIISFEMLVKYGKLLKKKLSCNTTLILDEADSICNINAKRTKATLNIGSKLRYKLLLSGTMVRNNITEAYSQFLLMYGSSGNFMSDNQYILSEDKDSKELIQRKNEYYGRKYPHYTRGFRLFQESFNPRKITVFGAEQNTQDVLNPLELKELINKSIITKTFEDVVGRNLYKIHQHNIDMNKSEKTLYKRSIDEFHSMKHLFTSTGNARKDRMLEIIQQITLLLNICRHPNTYKEYDSSETPNKYKKVIKMCQMWKDERIAIGTRTLKEIQEYKRILSTLDRSVYIVTGSTSMDNRLNIIEQLRNDKTGILLSTQQSLSVSVDIEFVDKVILSSLSWNWSTISQYFFRFVRFNSINNKEIHMITYKNSLENNLLYLISQKESLTNFMKNEESENILEKLGVSYNLVDMLLIKTRDSDGVKIKTQDI